MPQPLLDRSQEAERMLAMYQGDEAAACAHLERQFGIIHNRAQVLLGLAGVVITTTGFSGRLIAGTSRIAQASIIAGVALVLVAAGLVAWRVLPLQWITQHAGDSFRDRMIASLTYRDRKTAAYCKSVTLLLVGLVLYVVAVALMLIDPTAFDLGVGR